MEQSHKILLLLPCPSFGQYQLRNVLFTYVSWSNKWEEKILKILSLPSQEPFLFTMPCWLRGGENLLLWLFEVTCLSMENLCLSQVGSNDTCVSIPWFREPRKLRADTAEGSPVLFLWVAPLRWVRPTSSSLNPCSLWSWKQWPSVSLSLRTEGDVITARTWVGTRDRGVEI